MPVKIPDGLPALSLLEREGVPVIPESVAFRQDIRPLRIAILNLMPRKTATEEQLLRLIGNSPIQTSVTFLRTKSYTPTHTPEDHLARFYTTFEQVRNERFDGLIVTGAPVEHLEFTDVAYWEELEEVLEWSHTHAYSTLFLCWAALAALYRYHGVHKRALIRKLSGVFTHRVTAATELTRGFDERFLCPHSRTAGVSREEVLNAGLRILAESDDAGVHIAATHDERQVFVLGHPEYDRLTLKEEYERDKASGGLLPEHYFPGNDSSATPPFSWRSHAHLLYSNWLHNIYQRAPFNLAELAPIPTEGKDCKVCGKKTVWTTPFFGYPFRCSDPSHPKAP